MANLVEVIVALKNQASAGLKAVSGDLRELESTGSKLGSVLSGVGTVAMVGLGAAAVGLGAGLTSSISAAMGFEQGIANVGALVNATEPQMRALSDAAIKLGQDTTLSGIGATDAAAAMAQLAAAGFSVDDMTGGVTRGVLLLASATGTDVARAAAIAGDSFGAFRKSMGLTAADMPKIADLFVGAANVSSIGLEDIGESMKMVGPVAASMGITIEEVTAAIAALGNQGIKGGEAGTALRGVLASLVDPSKESAKLIKTLGLDFRDSAGKMKDFGGIAEELRTKTANLTAAQREQAIVQLFSRENLAAIMALMSEGQAGIDKYTAQIKEQGDSAAIGAKRNDTFKGAVEALTSSFETAQIALGQAFLPALKDVTFALAGAVSAAIPMIDAFGPRLVTAIGNGINRAVAIAQTFPAAFMAAFHAIGSGDFNSAFGPILAAVNAAFGGEAMAKVTLFVSNVLRGMQLARDAVLTAKQAFAGDWLSSDTIATPVRLVGEAFTLMGNAVRAVQGVIAQIPAPIMAAAAAFVALGPAVRVAALVLPTLIGAFTGLGPIISILTSTLPLLGTVIAALGWPITAVVVAVGLLAAAWATNFMGIQTTTLPILAAIGSFITGTFLPALTSIGGTLLTAVMPVVQQFIGFLTGQLLPGIQGVIAVAVPALQSFAAAALGAFQAALPGIQSFIGGMVALGAAVLPIIAQVAGMILATLGPAIMAIVDWAQVVIPQLGAAWVAVWGVVGPVVGAIAAFVGSTLTAIAGFITEHSATITSVLTGAWNVISGVVGIAFALITGIISAGLQAISGNWSGVWTTIQATAQTVWAGIQQVVTGAIAVIVGVVTVQLAAVQAIASNAWTAISTAATTAWNAIKTTVSSAFTGIVTAVITGVASVVTTMGGLGGRVLGAVGDFATLLYQKGVDLVQGLINGINSMIGAAAKAAGDLAGSVAGAVTGLFKSKSPSRLAMEIGGYFVEGLIIGMDDKKGEAAKKAAEIASAVAKGVTDTLGALRALSGFDAAKDGPTGEQLGFFRHLTESLVATMAEAASKFKEDALKQTAAFADTVGKVGGAVESAVKGLAAIGTADWATISPSGSAIGWFMFLTESLTRSFANSAARFDEDSLKAATVYAEAVGKVTGVLDTATKGLTALRTFVAPAEAAVSRFLASLGDLMEKFGTWAGGFEADGLAHSTLFAEAAGKVTSILDNGVKGLVALKGFAAPAEANVSSFMVALADLMERFGTWAGNFEADGLAASSRFAEAAQKVAGVIGPAVAGFKDLATMVAPSNTSIDQLVAGIRHLVQRFGEMATIMDDDGVKHMSAFAAATNTALGAAKTGTDLFKSFDKLVIPSAKAIDNLANGIRYVVGKFREMASEMLTEGIAQMQTFAGAAGQVLSAAKSGTDLFASMDKLAIPSKQAIDYLLGSMGYVITQTQAIANGIGTAGLQAAQQFATGSLNVFTTIKAALEQFGKLEAFKDIPTTALGELFKAMEGALEFSGQMVGRADEILQNSIEYLDKMTRAAINFSNGGAMGGANVLVDQAPGVAGGTFTLPGLPGRALGGPVMAGQAYEVGERGREYFIPRQSGTIVPGGNMGAGGGTTNHIYITVQGSVISEGQLVEKVRTGLLQKGRTVPTLGFN